MHPYRVTRAMLMILAYYEKKYGNREYNVFSPCYLDWVKSNSVNFIFEAIKEIGAAGLGSDDTGTIELTPKGIISVEKYFAERLETYTPPRPLFNDERRRIGPTATEVLPADIDIQLLDEICGFAF